MTINSVIQLSVFLRTCTHRLPAIATAVGGLVIAAAGFADDRVAAPSPGDHPFLKQHCVHCHDDSTTEGGLNLQNLNLNADDPVNLTQWAKVHDRVADGRQFRLKIEPGDRGRIHVEEEGGVGRSVVAGKSPSPLPTEVFTRIRQTASPEDYVRLRSRERKKQD